MRGADITQIGLFSYRTLEEENPSQSSPAQIAPGGGRDSGIHGWRIGWVVCRFWSCLDSARATAQGQFASDLVLYPIRTAVGGAY